MLRHLKVTSIKFSVLLNSEIAVEEFIENSGNLTLPLQSKEIEYSFEYLVPEVENETNITFVVYAVNERGNPYELSCTTKIEIPEKIAPDLGYLEVYGGGDTIVTMECMLLTKVLVIYQVELLE